MQGQSRIRWNAEERAAVVRRAQSLVAQNPKLRQSVLFKESQECLPVERRRESSGNAVGWLKAELAKAGPLPSPVTVWRSEAAEGADDTLEQATPTHASTQSRVGASGHAAPDTKGTSANRTVMVDQLVEIGVQLITGILNDARVRTAVSGLFTSTGPAAPMPAADPESAIAETPVAARSRGEFVVVAGCSSAEAKNLAKEVDGALDVRFWASDEPRERLLELLPDAEIVIGVSNGIPRAIESSLSRLGERYIRHTGGVQGLYRRLAEHAMR